MIPLAIILAVAFLALVGGPLMACTLMCIFDACANCGGGDEEYDDEDDEEDEV